MRKIYILIALALLISLFIYLFYRTEKTLVTEVFIRLISINNYRKLKAGVLQMLPLSDIVVYSLPEALWVFCITLTSRTYYFEFYKRRIECLYIPLLFCVGLELLQLVHITNGRFDFMDIGLSAVFWILGRYILPGKAEKHNLITRPNLKMMVCLASYGIVYLAHVFK
ncbi:hypothetical protein AAFN85_16735 [Mucilaginibacter sp. CAU 1740]|uniref:hypothetical protein n=1 Tax=Mucilaginibacter sp. CAU 1740 TaxID=3140365 RepID=UPI00325B1887